MKLWTWILDLVYPPKCPFCGKLVDDHGICPVCRAELPWTAESESVQRWDALVCASPLFYEGKVRESLLRLKFGGAVALGDGLGQVLAECAAERFSGEFDVVTWVPVSKKRRRKRGYDQARLLAESVCRRWDSKPEALVYKEMDNPAQSLLGGASARRANVLGVYEPIKTAKIAGRRVLLVDDIVTTGATLCECARTLRRAGAAEVLAVTLARSRPKAEKICCANGFAGTDYT